MMRFRLFLSLCLLLGWGTLSAQTYILISYPDSLNGLRHKLPAEWIVIDANHDKKAVTEVEAVAVAEKIIRILEQNGYPFAEVRLYTGMKSGTENKKEQIYLQVIANNYITWDSVVIKGNVNISPHFLAPYLKIKRGKPYDERLVMQATKALEALDYVILLQTPRPTFTKESAALYLYLDKRQSNTFDGYIGFTSNENGRGLQLYGQLNLKLANIFGRGESFAVSWNRLQQNYQTLSLEMNYPCLFQTPFGLYGQFSLLKNDTNYYKLSVPAGIRYLLRGSDYLQLYYRYEQSNLIGGGTNGTNGNVHTNNGIIRASSNKTYDSSILYQANYQSHHYGISIGLKRTDDPQMPHKGYQWESCFETGEKKITESAQNSRSWEGYCQGSSYLPLGKRWVQANRLSAGFISDQQLYESNLFLMGGLRSLRGVDEQSLRASSYLFISEEIRFLLNETMFVQAFIDGGWYERQLNGNYYHDTPVGIGTGFSLRTKNGVFSISWAIAAHDQQPFMFKSAKISLGYNAFF